MIAGEQQFHDFLTHSNISEEKLLVEIRVALSIDKLAILVLNEHNPDSSNISEEDKQQALASLLTKLLNEAEIIWLE